MVYFRLCWMVVEGERNQLSYFNLLATLNYNGNLDKS